MANGTTRFNQATNLSCKSYFFTTPTGSGQRAARQIAQRLWAQGTRRSRWNFPTSTTPTVSLSAAAETPNSSGSCCRGRTHDLRHGSSTWIQQRAKSVSRDRSEDRPAGRLDRPLFGPELRPGLGPAHAAQVCIGSAALRSLVGGHSQDRRRHRRGAHPLDPSGLRSLPGGPGTAGRRGHHQPPRMGRGAGSAQSVSRCGCPDRAGLSAFLLATLGTGLRTSAAHSEPFTGEGSPARRDSAVHR